MLNTPQLKPLLGQLARFGISGLTATFTYAAVGFALGAFTPLSPLTIHTIAFAIGMAVSYSLQSKFTFRYQGSRKTAIIRYITVYGSLYLLSAWLVAIMDAHQIHPHLITALQTVLIPALSFTLMRLWVFAQKSPQ